MGEAGGVRAPRGRPRSERARAAVLRAVAEPPAAGGTRPVTMEAIAARAGVSKATVYKWWPTRGHVVLESFFAAVAAADSVPPQDTDALPAETLTRQLAWLIRLLRDTAAGPLMAELIAAGQADPALGHVVRERWFDPRREAVTRLLGEAVRHGELGPGTDLAVTADQLLAPVYHRLMLGHGPLDDALAATLVRQVLRGGG